MIVVELTEDVEREGGDLMPHSTGEMFGTLTEVKLNVFLWMTVLELTEDAEGTDGCFVLTRLDFFWPY